MSDARWDAIVIGSGFGGAMAADRLVRAGARVLMLERGDWAARGEAAWQPQAAVNFGPVMIRDVRAHAEGRTRIAGRCACVGGPSVFFGGVAMRFREEDFAPLPEMIGDSGAAWPLGYDEIEPFYAEAERLIGVSGSDEGDPTAPRRSSPFPSAPAPLAPFSRRVEAAAAGLGHSPFRLPLAINYGAAAGRNVCRGCASCDGFACGIEAKNDVATAMIGPLVARGLTLWPRTIAVALEAEKGRIARVRALRRTPSGESEDLLLSADRVILSAGALGSAQLVLASRLAAHSPAADSIGRYLTRHANARVIGLFAEPLDSEPRFAKQVAVTDFYFGDPANAKVAGLSRLGSLQQMMLAPPELARWQAPRGTKAIAGALAKRMTAILCIAEDQPRRGNRVRLDWSRCDPAGLPRIEIECRYSERDRRARAALVRRARRWLRATGARLLHTHHVTTFSHAAGTLRMGDDPASAPLDREGKFRGLDNLWVADASALPTSGGVNPALTIAANALRVGTAAAA